MDKCIEGPGFLHSVHNYNYILNKAWLNSPTGGKKKEKNKNSHLFSAGNWKLNNTVQPRNYWIESSLTQSKLLPQRYSDELVSRFLQCSFVAVSPGPNNVCKQPFCICVKHFPSTQKKKKIETLCSFWCERILQRHVFLAGNAAASPSVSHSSAKPQKHSSLFPLKESNQSGSPLATEGSALIPSQHMKKKNPLQSVGIRKGKHGSLWIKWISEILWWIKDPERCRNLDWNKGKIQNEIFDHDWLRREIFNQKHLNMSNILYMVWIPWWLESQDSEFHSYRVWHGSIGRLLYRVILVLMEQWSVNGMWGAPVAPPILHGDHFDLAGSHALQTLASSQPWN